MSALATAPLGGGGVSIKNNQSVTINGVTWTANNFNVSGATPYERPAPHAARMLYTLILPISGDSTAKRSLSYWTSNRSPWNPDEICRARRSPSWPRPSRA